MVALNPLFRAAILLVVFAAFAHGMARKPRCQTQKSGECVDRRSCRSTAIIQDEHPILTFCPKQKKGTSGPGELVCCPKNAIKSDAASTTSTGVGFKPRTLNKPAASEECQTQPDKEKEICQTKHRGLCVQDEHCEHLVTGNVNHEDVCPDAEDLVCCNIRNSTSSCVGQSGVCMSWCATELRRSATGCSNSCPMCCIPIG